MIIPIGEWKPDVTDHRGGHTNLLNNVFPRGDGYGPVPDVAALTGAAAAACRGFFLGRNSDGTIAAFLGTSTKLYKLNNSTLAWADVSKAAGSYTTLSSDANWSFTQFGLNVIAVQENVAPQVFTLGSSSEFADLGGSPPQAAFCAIVFRFLVLSGLTSTPRKVKWSALNDITEWTAGTSQSGEQEFADGGDVRGVAGGEYGIVLQESAVRHMTYVPNSSIVIDFERIARDEGIYAPYSLVQAGDRTFYLSRKGFRAIAPGGTPIPIGAERVDRTFFEDLSETDLRLVIGASDPANNRVVWTRRSTGGPSSLFDKALWYDYQLDRWTPSRLVGEYIAPMSAPGLTLENLDSVQGSSIDALTLSWDDISTGDLPQLAIADTAHKLALFGGTNLEATVETPEQGFDQTRVRVQGLRPITDAATIYGSVGGRNTMQSAISYSTETLVNSHGICPSNVSTRYARGRLRIPAGTDWSFVSGVEPQFRNEGAR